MRIICGIAIEKIAIFGAGKLGSYWYNELKKDIEVTAFIDNNPQKQKDGYMGLPVYSVAEFSEHKEGVVVLISMYNQTTADTVTKQLEDECGLIRGVNLLCCHAALQEIEDEDFIKVFYYTCFGKELNLDNPTTLNEKMQWLKLYDRRAEYSVLADKYEVREFVASRIGEEYLIPLYGSGECFEDIDFGELPEEFVLKCTHDSGSVVIFRDGKVFEKYGVELLGENAAKNKLNDALMQNWFHFGREWAYKNVKPRIIAEKYLGKNIEDFRFYAFDGKVKFIHVDFDTAVFRKANIYTADWEYLPCSWTYLTDPEKVIEKPAQLDEMIRITERLAEGIPHLRVDLFLVDGKVYFLETGFYHGSGFDPFVPHEYDEIFGSWLKLPAKTEEN
ncbi:MAG: glycosyl transferase [Oscillospiraceae bacterium]|nr:glycosyl transferase [Oscillospiraceae bacterium]